MKSICTRNGNTLPESQAPGNISRRGVVIGAAATAAIVGVGPNVGGGKAFAVTPKKGGRFRVGLAQGATTDTLDPATFENKGMYGINWAMRSFLTEIGSDDKLKSELAESYEASNDAATWTFRLRKDIEFHNGKPLTTTDIITSINHHRGDDTKSGAKSLLQQVDDVTALDTHTVRFKLSSGNADFPYVLQDYHLPIMPAKGDGSVDWQSGIGTGAYVLQEFEPGQRAFFTRNRNYWKDGHGHFDEIEVLFIGDTVARQNALVSGAIDAIDQCDIKTVHLLESNPEIEVDDVTSGATHGFPMLCDIEPFNNNDARLAMKYAINRDDYLNKILRGHGGLGNDNPIGANLPYHADSLPQRNYDSDRAKFHLKKAGLGNFKIDLHVAEIAWAGAVESCVLYKEHAKSAGIDINVVKVPNDGFWNSVWQKKPLLTSGWGARPTPDLILSLVYSGGAPWNESHWQNDRFDELLVQARAELNEQVRAEMYYEMQSILRDDGPAIIPAFNNFVSARRSNVHHGPTISSAYDLDGYKAFERWWFADV